MDNPIPLPPAVQALDDALLDSGVHVTNRTGRREMAKRIAGAGMTPVDLVSLFEYLRDSGTRNVGAALAKLVQGPEDLADVLDDVRRYAERKPRAAKAEPDHVRRSGTLLSPKCVRCTRCAEKRLAPFFTSGGDFDYWPDVEDDDMASRAFCRHCGVELNLETLVARHGEAPHGGRVNPW